MAFVFLSIALICDRADAVGPVPIFPATVVEGTGVLTNAGQVNLGSVAASNTVVGLQSSDATLMGLPASVTILSGQSNAFFNVMAGDNLVADGTQLITASAITDFSTNATTITVLESDPDYIQFSAVPAITDTNTGFTITATAINADGSVQTNFNRSLTMIATALEGMMPLASTNSGAFTRGVKNVSVQVIAPGHGVQIRTAEYPGQSAGFTVIPSVFYSSPQSVADIAWVPSTQTLLATVPANGGTYSNCIVAIDPASGLVTNAYPIGYNPSQIEISPDGTYLYVALSNRAWLQCFDVAGWRAGTPFALGTNSNPFRFAYDFCIPPTMTNSVVVAARLQDNIGNQSIDGIYRYDSGSIVALANLSKSGGWLVESMTNNSKIALSPPLATANASAGTVIATASSFSGKAVIYRGGEFFDDQGNAYSEAFSQLGSYPGMLDQSYYSAVAEVDTTLRRAFFLTGYFNYGTTFYKLKVYDRDLFQPLFQMQMPGAAGTPTRLLRCGTNCLAYVTGNNQVWFVRPDATQPPGTPADLSLSTTAPGPAPIAGTPYSFSLTLSNAGPGISSVVNVTNALPPNTTLLQTIASTGSVTTPNPSNFIWNVADLGVGSSATLQVTVQFNNGGWQTNSAWALGFEADPVFTNNASVFPLNVQLSQQAVGVFAFNYGTQDLLYDPLRDRLLLSVGAGGHGQSNGLAVFNPYTGSIESFSPMPVTPGKIARSDNGQFLYVSLPDLGTVEQLNLQNLTTNYSFAVGGEMINGAPYTNYAADLAVVPGQPNSVVAWALRHVNGGSGEYGYGITLYQNGIMAPNVTATGGSWAVRFDTNTGTLLGYNGGDLRRCTLDSSGVTFAQQYPTILYTAGADIEYGGGHLFTSGGEMVEYNPFKVDWLFTGAQGGAVVTPDPAADKVFYLGTNGGWQIKAYDIPTQRFLGSLSIANLLGTPGRMIRWGTNGLAFTTTSNQLFIVRSSLIPTNAFADLALTISGPQGPIAVGTNATFVITLTNQGTVAATNVMVTTSFSSGTTLTSATSGVGTVMTAGAAYWTIPSLLPGASATLSCFVTAGQAGLVTASSSATTSSFDPVPSNNTVLAAILAGPALGIDATETFQLQANDFAWSPSQGKFLATANSNVLNWGGVMVGIDPLSLSIQPVAQLGSDAGRVASSSDDTVLYAATDAGVSTVSIPSLTVTNRFLINPTSPSAATYAYDMKVAPGNAQLVAVGSKDHTDNMTWVDEFAGGIQLSNADSFYCTVLTLEFSSQSSPLYSYNGSSFNRYTASTNGLTLLDSNGSLLPSAKPLELVRGNGLIYSSLGQVINPTNDSLVGTISGIPPGSHLVYDPTSGWLFFLRKR